ncbi:MAG: hypothetical protein J4400_04190 [Candidatus Aenigmarchaeota archaeon]|nr:hypothetical protein [Candidatus Aenigmarchaeota archaeon]
MYASKKRFLERLTPKFPSVKLGKTIDGTSPPSIFVGREGYPKVFVGPLVTEQKGDTFEMDTPEAWLGKSKMQIIGFRMQLARGMKQVGVTDIDDKIVGKMRDIALAGKTVDANAEFSKIPRGYSFNEDHQPFGPSAPLKSMEISNVRFEHHMEKAYNDSDMNARAAIVELYEKGVLVSQIQKALSIGAFGVKRRLVPTRWSITAVDDTLGKNLLDSVRSYPVLDRYLVYEFGALENYFAILLTPTQWQYEFLEVFLGVMGQAEMIFSDWEPYGGRTAYAGMGGCYYSTRLAIAEKLDSMKKQSGAIVFRESYSSYTPLGVWLVRESARKALQMKPREFSDMSSALNYIANKTQLPFWKYRRSSVLLRQSRLTNFC